MEIIFIEKDNIWQNETTNYWFKVNGKTFALSDCNGELTLLDCDGCPADVRYNPLKDLLIGWFFE